MNMKFIRKAQRKLKFQEKAVDILGKALLIGISVLACLWMVSGAHAAPISITGITSQPASDGAYAIDFSLSQKITSENVAVEFERNFIQISLKGVSAYPARTENINQGSLEKVFTYQYQPDLARARVLLKTTAASIKGKASWEITAHGLRILVKGSGFTAQAVTDTVKNKSGAASSTEAAPMSSDTDEERIVQQILNESKNGAKSASISAIAPSLAKAGEESPVFSDKKLISQASTEDQVLFAAKNTDAKPKDNTATRIVASLLLVIGIIGACAVAFRRFALGKGIPFQRQNRVIETIATQSLGPKRSVAVIKVLDQYMVIGMSGEGMSLLANLGNDVKIDKFIDQAGGPGSSFTNTFESALAGITGKADRTDSAGPPLTHKAAQIELGIRSSIKKRISGFKPL